MQMQAKKNKYLFVESKNTNKNKYLLVECTFSTCWNTDVKRKSVVAW